MILHLVPHFGLGGDLVAVKAIVRIQTASGLVVTVNGMDPETAFDNSRTDNPFPLNEGRRGFMMAWRNRKRLAKGIRVLHVHSPICLLFALMLQKTSQRGATVIFTFHWPVPDYGLRQAVKGWLFRSASRVQVCSVETEETIKRRYSVPDERVRLLHLGVPEDRFMQREPGVARDEMRNRLGIGAKANVIGYLGRMALEKNLPFLLRFMEEHGPQDPDLHWVIAGTGDLESELRERAQKSLVREQIHFLGYTCEPETVYPCFDLLVLPSSYEAFALVVVEAAYCGVPTLRSDVDGSRDQITEGVNGFLYPEKEGYKGMERALLRILAEEWQRLPEVGAAAHEHCRELCDMERFRVGLEALYDNLNV